MTTEKTEKKPLSAKGYVLDDHPEHMALVKPHTEKWIANALSTEPMNDEDRRILTEEAMPGLYKAADFEPPKIGVFGSGPISSALGSAVAACVWWIRQNPKEHVSLFGGEISESDLQRLVPAAVKAALGERVIANNPVGYEEALRVAFAAIGGQTPTNPSTLKESVFDKTLELAMACCNNWWRIRNGGNQWAAWPAYLDFFQNVIGIELPDYDKLRHYETAARHGGPRYMHAMFWVVSDRPTVVGRDDQGRPHSDTGPQLAWKDGFKTWYIHGVRVNEQIVMRPDTLTTKQIDDEGNAEVRRVMLDRFGWSRYLTESGVKPVSEDRFGKLYRKEIPGDEMLTMVEVVNSTAEPDGTFKRYFLRVDPSCQSAHEAVASTFRFPDGSRVFKDYRDYNPAIET